MSFALRKSKSYSTKNLHMSGPLYEEMTCFSMSRCVDDFTVMAANSIGPGNRIAVEGVLGLNKSSDSLVYKMYEAGVIPEPTFSLRAS
jgi:hypothetical protein